MPKPMRFYQCLVASLSEAYDMPAVKHPLLASYNRNEKVHEEDLAVKWDKC